MARIWDWRAGAQTCPPLRHAAAVFDVAFAQKGKWAVTASSGDRTARIWDTSDGKPMAPAIPVGSLNLAAAVDPNGNFVLFSGGTYRTMRCFSLADLRRPDALSLDNLCLRCELIAGQRIDSAGGVSNLTADEWLERWRVLRHGAAMDALTPLRDPRQPPHDLRPAPPPPPANQFTIKASKSDWLRTAKATPDSLEQAIFVTRPTLRISFQQSYPYPSTPPELLMYGELCLLDDDRTWAIDSIRRAINAGGREPRYHRLMGVTLLWAGRRDEARAEFRAALDAGGWTPAPPAAADVDAWTAAFYLGLLSSDQYHNAWPRDNPRFRGCEAGLWLSEGMQLEAEGDIARAISAYQGSVASRREGPAEESVNCALYRLKVLAERSTTRPADR
jgi:hypothetical protein